MNLVWGKKMIHKILRSIANNRLGITLICLAALVTSIGQMFWKLAEAEHILYIVVGFAMYCMGMVLMIVSFKYGQLSVLHPLMSTGYIFGLVLGCFFLGEDIQMKEFAGVLIIFLGAVLLGGGGD